MVDLVNLSNVVDASQGDTTELYLPTGDPYEDGDGLPEMPDEGSMMPALQMNGETVEDDSEHGEPLWSGRGRISLSSLQTIDKLNKANALRKFKINRHQYIPMYEIKGGTIQEGPLTQFGAIAPKGIPMVIGSDLSWLLQKQALETPFLGDYIIATIDAGTRKAVYLGPATGRFVSMVGVLFGQSNLNAIPEVPVLVDITLSINGVNTVFSFKIALRQNKNSFILKLQPYILASGIPMPVLANVTDVINAQVVISGPDVSQYTASLIIPGPLNPALSDLRKGLAN